MYLFEANIVEHRYTQHLSNQFRSFSQDPEVELSGQNI